MGCVVRLAGVPTVCRGRPAQGEPQWRNPWRCSNPVADPLRVEGEKADRNSREQKYARAAIALQANSGTTIAGARADAAGRGLIAIAGQHHPDSSRPPPRFSPRRRRRARSGRRRWARSARPGSMGRTGSRGPAFDPTPDVHRQGDNTMDLSNMISFLLWCTIINGGLLLLWTGAFMVAPEWVYRTQHRFFPIPRQTFNVVMYAFLGAFKIFVLVFHVVPLAALLIMRR
jgi:hypothetical protein